MWPQILCYDPTGSTYNEDPIPSQSIHADRMEEPRPSDAVAPAAATTELVSDDDLATCVRVLRTLATPEGISDAYREPRCKPLRVAMNAFLEDAQSRQFHGQKPDKYALRKQKKSEKHAREQQQKAFDRQATDNTTMRAERLRMLSELEASAALTGGAPQLAFVPDGAVGDGSLLLKEGGGTAVDDGAEPTELTELQTLHSCYTCKVRFRLLHHFYASLCPSCAELNYAKRMQSADLAGRVFIVTGGRVKCGFQVVLKLLRCGATVLATSRFPADTASRFAAQPDAASWQARLQCYGLDLRDLSSLERFCAHLIRRNQRARWRVGLPLGWRLSHCLRSSLPVPLPLPLPSPSPSPPYPPSHARTRARAQGSTASSTTRARRSAAPPPTIRT